MWSLDRTNRVVAIVDEKTIFRFFLFLKQTNATRCMLWRHIWKRTVEKRQNLTKRLFLLLLLLMTCFLSKQANRCNQCNYNFKTHSGEKTKLELEEKMIFFRFFCWQLVSKANKQTAAERKQFGLWKQIWSDVAHKTNSNSWYKYESKYKYTCK